MNYASLQRLFRDRKNIGRPIPRIVCEDGFSMSVQAGSANYCSPRDEFGPYTKFEIGFPSEKVDVLMDYAEEPDSPTDTVYGWVPVDLVVKIINEHGGIYGT